MHFIKTIKEKKNFYLFLLLVLALVITYWVEERGRLSSSLLEKKRTEVLNSEGLGELLRVYGLKINIIKKKEVNKETYFDAENNLPILPQRFNEFFIVLKNLKIKAVLNDRDINKVGRPFYIANDALNLKFEFEKGEVSFSLGKKLSFDQTFYMEILEKGKKKIAIVSDESSDPGVYNSEQEYLRSEAKYKRLSTVFALTNQFFYDTRVFKDLYQNQNQNQNQNENQKAIHFEQITISTFRNKKFSVNFKETKTIPSAPKGISYFPDNWISFHRSLEDIKGRTLIFPYKSHDLSEVLSQFEIKDRDGRMITLVLYKKYGDQNGYFLTSSMAPSLYALDQEDARFFFVNIQDFWRKKLNAVENEYLFELKFFNQKESDKLKITDRELFKVETDKKLTPRTLEFKKLIDFLKGEADNISELTSDDKIPEMVKKSLMTITYENKNLLVLIEENDLVVLDLNLKLKFHYYVGANLPFSLKHSDYFEKK